MKTISILGVPSSVGARQTGQEQAPHLFRRAGLIDYLGSAGLETIDLGDLPRFSFQPDPQNPKAQNLQLVAKVTGLVAEKVSEILKGNNLPVILGGDCTISLGVVSAMIRKTPDLGLMYFDADVDLNTPDTTPSGIFDGMVIAHMTGRGADELARSGSRYPLLPEDKITLFGFNSDSGSIDDAEIELLEQSEMMKFPISQVQGRAIDAAGEALRLLEKSADSVLVHFDVDVIDFGEFPAGDVPHYNGLSFDEAMNALEVFLSSSRLGGLVITEFNAGRDNSDKLAERFVHRLVKILKQRAR